MICYYSALLIVRVNHTNGIIHMSTTVGLQNITAQLYEEIDLLANQFLPIRFDVSIVLIETIVTSNLIGQSQPVYQSNY